MHKKFFLFSTILLFFVLTTILFAESYDKFLNKSCLDNSLVNYNTETTNFDKNKDWHIYVPNKNVTVICRNFKIFKIVNGKSELISSSKKSYEEMNKNALKSLSAEQILKNINRSLSNSNANLSFKLIKSSGDDKAINAKANSNLVITFFLKNNNVTGYTLLTSGADVKSGLDKIQCIVAMVSALENTNMKPYERKKILDDFGLLNDDSEFSKKGKITINRSGNQYTLEKIRGIIALTTSIK